MKRTNILAIISIAVCCACQQAPGYRLSGTIDGAQDGDTVKLLTYEGWETIVVQETTIQNGEFVMTGRKDTADFYYLSCVSKGQPLASVQFILENGDIRIQTQKDSYSHDINGTPTNEAWCIFHNENERLCGESMKIYRALQDSTLSAEQREKLEVISAAKDKELMAHRLQFCKDNIQNVAGAHSLVNYQKYFNPQEVAQLMARIPEQYQSESLLSLRREMETKQRTAIGQPFTDFTMFTPDGKELSVADVARNNKVVMIDFWASWCGPCKMEMPHVKAAYEKYKNKGFEILGVSLDHPGDSWEKAIKSWELPWLHISDLKAWKCEGAALYGVTAIPATVLIQDGKIVARNLRGEDISRKLEELLGK